jgi:hypothetical protein
MPRIMRGTKSRLARYQGPSLYQGSSHEPSMRRRKKQPESHLLDLADFRASLWKTLAVNAKPLTGLQVAKALQVISDDVYHAGIDAAYTTTKVRDARNVADAWDLTWLTALNIKLLHLQKSASRRKQARG